MTVITDKISECQHKIIAAYREPHRRYHDYRHIAYMLSYVANKYGNCTDVFLELVVAAILFHDIVYEPGSPVNEEKSIVVFEEWVGQYINPIVSADIKHAIMRTKLGLCLKKEFEPNPITEVLLEADHAYLHDSNKAIVETGEADMLQEFLVAFPTLPLDIYKSKRLAILELFGATQYHKEIVAAL